MDHFQVTTSIYNACRSLVHTIFSRESFLPTHYGVKYIDIRGDLQRGFLGVPVYHRTFVMRVESLQTGLICPVRTIKIRYF